MNSDQIRLQETAGVQNMPELTPAGPREVIGWHCKWELRKFNGDSTAPEDLYELKEGEGNLLVNGGASALWNRLTGGGGTMVAAFDDTNSHIGVGDSSTATTADMINLQAATNKFRKIADVTHTDAATGSGAANVTFISTYATGEANFAWNEWAVFNDPTAGRMLNRRVESLGTKTSAATWQLTITLTLGGGA